MTYGKSDFWIWLIALIIVAGITVALILIGRSDSKSISNEEKGYQEKASAGAVVGIVFGCIALLFLPFAFLILPGIGLGGPGLGI